MIFRTLGPLSVRAGEHWHTPAGSLQRSLLGVLLARTNQPVPPDTLAEELWGAPHESTSQRLQVHVHRLRRTLDDPDRVRLEAGGYLLRIEPEELDSEVFDALARQALADSTDPAARISLAERALALWRGRAYDGTSGWICTSEAERLEARRLDLQHASLAAHVELGRHREVLTDLTSAAAAHPLHEGLQESLIKALHASGRRSDALATFRRTRAALVAELGVEPGSRLQQLHEEVLLGTSTEPPAPPPPAPRQLPPAPPLLAGRDDALDALEDAMAGDTASVAVLVGTPGVGKTALALTWAHRREERYPDGQLHCDLRGFGEGPSQDPGDVLDSFIRALGGTPQPSSVEEKAALFRSHLAGRRMLVVLDNAASESQVRPLLPATPGCDTLVTSRMTCHGLGVRDHAQILGIAPLHPDVALCLMRDALGDRLSDEPEAAAVLVGRCAGLPLALRIVAHQLRARPALSLTALAAEISEAASPLDGFDLGEESTSVRAVLGWSYQSLTEDAQRVMRTLGLFPGWSADAPELAAMTALDPATARTALALLVRSNLVDEVAAGRHSQHDLLRSFAAERAVCEEGPEERARMHERLLAHYVAGAVHAARLTLSADQGWPSHADEVAGQHGEWMDTPEAARAWFATHHESVIACAAAHDALRDPAREGDRLVRDLAQVCSGLLLESGTTSVAVPLFDAWRHAAARIGDVREEIRAAILRASALRDAGDGTSGEREARAAIDRAMEHGHEDVAARGMLNLGVVILSAGRAPEAHDLYRQALEVDVRLEREDHARLVRANLATTLVLLGRHQEAIDTATCVVVESRATGDTYNEAFGTQIIGEALLRRGDPAGALEHALRARSTAAGIGALARVADVTHLVGAVLLAEGRPQAALEEFQSGLAQSREIRNLPIMLEMLVGCADALCALGSPEAQSYLLEAQATARSTGDREQEEELLHRLGDQRLQPLS